MVFSPGVILFLHSIFISIFMTLSSCSLFLAWIALELNTLAFIPIITASKELKSGEAALKYFLSQTLGSICYLLSMVFFSSNLNFELLYLLALTLKLGGAPIHGWLPSMVNSLPWLVFFLLLTIQSINPLILLMVIHSNATILKLSILSLLVGSVIGLTQTSTRKIFAYSSINQIGWLMASLWVSSTLMIMYFMFYAILLSSVVLLCKETNVSFIYQLLSKKMDSNLQLIFFTNLLSFGGLPPFLGFLPKWILLQELINEFMLLISLFLVLTSLLTLMYYLRLTLSAFMINSTHWHMLQVQPSGKLMYLTMLSVSWLPLSVFF